MKKIIKYAGFLFVSLVLVACAATPLKMANKYNFDNDLKEITDITSFRIDSWQSIDDQSLILKTDINNYYLVILQYPAFNLPFAQSIGVSESVGKISKGFDSIIVTDSGHADSYRIYKMYKIDSKEKVAEIKKKIKNS
jgi:hypothetical protein